jgi:hypothetical protein
MAGITATVLLGLAAASTAKTLMDKGPAKPALPPAPPPDTKLNAAATAHAIRQKRKGQAFAPRPTLLTGPQGVQRSTLLGGGS